MSFVDLRTAATCALVLEELSLLLLADAARYHWQHGIAPRKTDTINGIKRARRRRVSVTFRTVLRAVD
jgi:alkylated DNA repair dioxygenase AlkB